jgi:hypothetical protein
MRGGDCARDGMRELITYVDQFVAMNHLPYILYTLIDLSIHNKTKFNINILSISWKQPVSTQIFVLSC